MGTAKKVGLTGGLALLVLAFVVPASYANDFNQATELTFNQSVRVPGQVLPAGTYWFSILNSAIGSDDVIQVYNADRSKPITLLFARTIDKTGGNGQYPTIDGIRWPTGKLVLTFAEGRNQQPAALLDWFYPGRTDGHELVYSNWRQKQLDEERHQTIAINVNNNGTTGTSFAALK